MFFIGVDTAHVNCGYSILRITQFALEVVYSKTVVTPDRYKESDITKAYFQTSHLRKLISLCKTDTVGALAMESPAFGYQKSNNFSIGAIHGAFFRTMMDSGHEWAWIPSTKLRYAFLGNGHADKSVGVKWMKDNFDLTKSSNIQHPIDDNMADATTLAYCAYLLSNYLVDESFKIRHFDEGTQSRLRHIFLDHQNGILYHPYQFYYSNKLNLYK